MGKLLPGLIAVIILPGCGVNQVIPASNSFEGRGASYYLPRTVVMANVPVKTVTAEPPSFPDYSLPLLLMEPTVIEKSKSFALGNEVSLELAGEKDPAHRFIAIDPRGPFKTFSRTMTFNEHGILTKGDASVENKTVEFTVSTMEAVAKIASSAIKPASGANKLFPSRPGLEDLRVHVNSLDNRQDHALTLPGLRAGLNILLADNSDNYLENLRKVSEFQDAVSNWEDFADNCPKGLSEMLRATGAFKQLRELAAVNQSATAAADRSALRDERDALLAKFIGKKSEKVWIGQFRWVPLSRKLETTSGSIDVAQLLFVLSKHEGISSFIIDPEVPPTGGIRSLQPDTHSPRTNTSPGNQAKDEIISVSLACHSIVPVQTKTWKDLIAEKKKHGWHYRIPAEATVRLEANGVTRIMRRCYIGQHGCVAFVPATTAGAKITSNIELDSITGALKSSVHGGQAFDPGLVNRSGAAVAGVVDAEKAREKAEAAANDPVTKLERKKKLLQLEKELRSLEETSPP